MLSITSLLDKMDQSNLSDIAQRVRPQDAATPTVTDLAKQQNFECSLFGCSATWICVDRSRRQEPHMREPGHVPEQEIEQNGEHLRTPPPDAVSSESLWNVAFVRSAKEFTFVAPIFAVYVVEHCRCVWTVRRSARCHGHRQGNGVFGLGNASCWSLCTG